jgi:hypothetical protein
MPKLSPETLKIAASLVENEIDEKKAATDVSQLAPLFKALEELVGAGADISTEKPKKQRASRQRGLPKNADQPEA